MDQVRGESVVVRVARPEACDHCAARNACETFGQKKEHLARARNVCGAAIGDRVKIRIPASSLLLSALVIYFLPALGLFVGALAGHHLLFLQTMGRDAASLLGGVGTLLVVVGFVALYAVRRRNNVLPEAFEVISPDPDETGGCSV